MRMPDRLVAGLRCAEVLEALPDYLEHALPPQGAQQVEAHLRGCDWCERFGGEYAGGVAALRRMLAEPPAPPAAVRTRLRERLAALPPPTPRNG